jgi:DGQHR domain-containing protein
MGRTPLQKDKKTGANRQTLTFPCIRVIQSDFELFVFKMKASVAWTVFSISRKEPDGNKGYQRFLSAARVASVSKYITAGNPIPVSVLVSIDNGKFNSTKTTFTIPGGNDVGWIIDGQHRLAGAAEAATEGHDIDLIVAAFVGLDERHQIQQFVTINDEAKGVPRSLLFNLLKQIPDKTLQEQATERAVDLARQLNNDQQSVFFQRIASIVAPRTGQISDVNFARKVSPLVHPEKGLLRIYPLNDQLRIVENYYTALRDTFPEEFRKSNSLFFRTIGFGAAFNAFDEVFTQVLSEHGTFRVSDIKKLIGLISDYEVAEWEEFGTGNKPEQLAALNFLTALRKAVKATSKKNETTGKIAL